MKYMIPILLILILTTASLQARSPWLGSDKPMHLLSSAYLVYWNYNFSNNVMNYNHQNSLFISVSITTFIGTGKEVSDRYIKKTRFSWYDMGYNLAGIALGVALVQISN